MIGKYKTAVIPKML